MIHTVNLDLTTHCNKRCPDCCAGVGINRVLGHHDWSYFETAAKWLQGIERINLTGGEPTAHPKFAEFVPRFRELFGCTTLTMNTNGYRVIAHLDTIVEHFTWVDFSDYGDNHQALNALLGRGVKVGMYNAGPNGANFVPRIRRAEGKPCSRACFISDGCAYADGKFFGCCVGPGIPTATPLEPQIDWKTILPTVPLPCNDCWFAE